MASNGIKIYRKFSKRASALRNYYDQVYASETHPGRFTWDLWDVPGQYHLLRSPATHFFPKEMIDGWMEELVLWGRKNLGCHTISPVWLSAYVEGCEQKLHVDKPHGPWAFVFSLTTHPNRFEGGNTLVLRDEIMNYWSESKAPGKFEMSEIFHSIQPNFNQLLVFDGRIPHGVERVSKAHSMKDARLVLHGWFLPPRPFIEGKRSLKSVERFMDQLLQQMKSMDLFNFSTQGFICLRFHVSNSGNISQQKILSSTLRSGAESNKKLSKHESLLLKVIGEFKFSKIKSAPSKTGSWITLPIEIA